MQTNADKCRQMWGKNAGITEDISLLIRSQKWQKKGKNALTEFDKKRKLLFLIEMSGMQNLLLFPPISLIQQLFGMIGRHLLDDDGHNGRKSVAYMINGGMCNYIYKVFHISCLLKNQHISAP